MACGTTGCALCPRHECTGEHAAGACCFAATGVARDGMGCCIHVRAVADRQLAAALCNACMKTFLTCMHARYAQQLAHHNPRLPGAHTAVPSWQGFLNPHLRAYHLRAYHLHLYQGSIQSPDPHPCCISLPHPTLALPQRWRCLQGIACIPSCNSSKQPLAFPLPPPMQHSSRHSTESPTLVCIRAHTIQHAQTLNL